MSMLSHSQINTNQGRFELTSGGDLQIVQVHKSDSGTYVCVADNGIGIPVEREVKLEIAGKYSVFFFVGYCLVVVSISTSFVKFLAVLWLNYEL